eukprot:TRINITY_DN5184_c0_g1_i1.p1 TRINITY_DN5184_c0_g1~~TRINITY_DN5184_c0_g1_i1.p1  ORF type:complete len:451 (+),score=128.00 TRINITY_DN5184_c0_g1_i1:154-1506(+)
MDPYLHYLLSSTIMENDVSLFASNLYGLPVFARVGSQDRTVSAYFMRRYSRLLSELGVDLTFDELSGKDHWWWDTSKANDGGVMFDPKVRSFFKTRLNKIPQAKEVYTITSYNPATFFGKAGVKITQLKIRFRKAEIRFTKNNKHWTLNTKNVARFQFYELPLNASVPLEVPSDGLTVDSTTFTSSDLRDIHSSDVNFVFQSNKWTIERDALSYQIQSRGPTNYGPARQVFSSPFIIVVPTSCGQEEKEFYLHLAVYISTSHYQSSSTYAPVIYDSDLSKEEAEKYNLILIGGPDVNLWSQQLTQLYNESVQLVLSDEKKKVTSIGVGPCMYTGNDIGLLFLFQSHKSQEKAARQHQHQKQEVRSALKYLDNQANLNMMITGTDKQAVADIVNFSFSSSPPLTRAAFTNMVPDYLVSGPEYRWKGYGGLLAAGHFDNNWKWSPSTSFSSC